MTDGKTTYRYLAAFDLDKTLLSINSSRLVVMEARKRKFMRTRDYYQAIYFSIMHRFDLKDPGEIVRSMMKWIKGLNEDEFISLMNQYAIGPIIASIRNEMTGIINEHRQHHGKVILLSSAMPYICDPVAEATGMDDVVCSRLEVTAGRFTGKTIGPLVFGPEKAVRMKAYCETHGFDPSAAYYYGDAYSDRFVLSLVGSPVCVSPERRLRHLARREGWDILDFPTRS
jgi:HAD superfamily hydrolase (TIGR01490 family)